MRSRTFYLLFAVINFSIICFVLLIPSSSKPTTDSSAGKQVHILIISSWRSGSSFLGSIFNNHPEVFYTFEPGHPVWMKLLYESAELLHYPVRDLIHSLFKCDVSPLYSYLQQGGKQLSEFMFFYESRALCMHPTCQSSNTSASYNRLHCFNTCGGKSLVTIEETCRNHSHIAMKTVRIFDLKVLIPLLQDPKLDLRIIHLVRDPRAVSSSRKYFDLSIDDKIVCRDALSNGKQNNKTPNITEIMGTICKSQVAIHKVGRDVKYFLPENYMLVRHEDLALDPLSNVNKLYSFSGLGMIPELKHWVYNVTHKDSSSEPDGLMSYSRQSLKVTQNWKRKLNFKIIKEIQEVCREAMELFEYQPLESESDLRKSIGWEWN
ncbi:carbohydrate sulfotransferase 6-like [Pelobates fuscus]|uniref:carbohydrate sulfotransferase 6-like n=1 Tax=Pelobates fuscus TaxID=191477 RepID=UPI002FE44B34